MSIFGGGLSLSNAPTSLVVPIGQTPPQPIAPAPTPGAVTPAAPGSGYDDWIRNNVVTAYGTGVNQQLMDEINQSLQSKGYYTNPFVRLRDGNEQILAPNASDAQKQAAQGAYNWNNRTADTGGFFGTMDKFVNSPLFPMLASALVGGGFASAGGLNGLASAAVPTQAAAPISEGLGGAGAGAADTGALGSLYSGYTFTPAAGLGADGAAATTGGAAMGDGFDWTSLFGNGGDYTPYLDASSPAWDSSSLFNGYNFDPNYGSLGDRPGMANTGSQNLPSPSELSQLSQFMRQNPWAGKLIGGIGGPVLNRLMNGGNNNQGPAPYQMQHQGAADNMLWDTANQQANQSNQYYGATLPESQAALQEQLNNPYAHSYIDNSAAAGAMAGRAAGQMEQGGNNLMGQGQQLYGEGQQALGAGQQVFNTAMDPQQALYNRTLHQTLDQTRAGLEARGLDMSGAGAGIEAQALDNFNMDWQNNQLGRQVQGMQALNQGYGDAIQGGNAYGRDAAAAGALYGQGQQFQQAAGQLPYAAQGQVGQDQQTAIANYENSLNPYFAGMQQNVNNMDAYLGRGQANQTNAFNQFDANRTYNTNQSNDLAYGIGNMFGSNNNNPGYFGGGSFSF